ncbi:galactokinase, partial [Quaeritorhiza haematococci]
VFVVANTLVVADKHKTAPTNYNLRVVETRLAAALLAKKLDLPPLADEKALRTLRMVADEWVAREVEAGRLEPAVKEEGNEQGVLKRMVEIVEREVRKEPFTREEIAKELDMSVPDLESKFIGTIEIRADVFKIYARAKHVYSEAKRVFAFRDVCEGKTPYSGELLKDLGTLMNESQESCRDLFNCSCDEIDELTEICRSSGATGSRLTGAGWGGCTVSLVPEDLVPSFVSSITNKYYTPARKEQAR